jgi:hypothetical protein
MLADLYAHMKPPGSKTYTEIVLLGRSEAVEFTTPDGCARVYMSFKSVMKTIVDVRHDFSMIVTGMVWTREA